MLTRGTGRQDGMPADRQAGPGYRLAQVTGRQAGWLTQGTGRADQAGAEGPT